MTFGSKRRLFQDKSASLRQTPKEVPRAPSPRPIDILHEFNRRTANTVEESSLIEEACRTIVDIGGYRMAWVGYALHSEPMTFKIMAHAGVKAFFQMPGKIWISWNENEARGLGPMGQAVRTGQACVLNSVVTAPASRHSNTKNGNHESVIALPLFVENTVIGALAIWSENEGAFGEYETNLLGELATNLSLRIAASRLSEKKTEAEKLMYEIEERYRAILAILEGVQDDITDPKRTRYAAVQRKECPSQVMQDVLSQAFVAARKDVTVLLTGESGTGKDHLAKYIHEHSTRANGPYFSVNCAAIAPELAESELFGHEKGAFTGAVHRKRGLLELAEDGTLLLNEIGELSLALQTKLLAFLDTRTFTRVGGETSVSVNARLIAATNRILKKEVDAGRFRKDLFYRLNVISITVPPLRERREDIPALVQDLLFELCSDLQCQVVPGMDDAVLSALMSYDWPGNVRELKNVIERSLILSGAGPFQLALVPGEAGFKDSPWKPDLSVGRKLREIMDEVVKSVCSNALRQCRGNKREAARILGISRDCLYRHMKRLGMDKEHW
ncbi:MAG: sigma-54-dependent Fis family transcriptional regulator [Desulfomonile tiedjei]|uniref:Sigma-54-dependent Fis family transcriptional regulator n=1 Tax=Desulfomonile tiedjei TaxID=2358 RepID=A0A9D6UYN6_9BACT|nr:sigma-54-dependent Fis family transcriptional regulator [Desulfomonile tiedjei]